MKKFNNKKGFTIVELVIVVAVIGVLTAVLVPTFVNLVNKANNASDESLVKNLNTQLRMKEQTEGKNVILSEALEDAKEAGYLVENLTPKGSRDIVWNQDKDEFGFGDEAKGDLYKYWTIAKSSADLAKGYSVYLNFAVSEIETHVGVDVGSYSGVSVKYTKGATPKDDVRMRTDGGTLDIDADTDVVSHWSYIDKVAIKAIKGDSYHEYGTVGVGLEVEEGHVVVEPNGYVEELSIPETATDVSVQIENDGEVNTAVIDSTEATVKVDSGATVSQVVGETDKITGAGAEEAKESVITKTYVYNTADEDKLTLQQALAAGKEYIVFAEDLEVAKLSSEDNVAASLTYDVTIDGAGHTLTTTAGRGIWIDESNVTATVKNLKLVGKNNATERGIQVNGGMRGVKLSIDNVELANMTMYSVNVCNNVDVDLRITNSKIVGWGAINLWSAQYSVYIANSELVGHNDKGYNAKGWNDFGTVVLEGDTTGQTTDHSSVIDVNIVNTKITATTSGQGNKQWCVLFNDQCTSNNVKLSGCQLDYKESENTFKFLDQGEGNKLIIDGTQVN